MKTTLPTLILAATLCTSGLATRPARAQSMDFGQVYITAGMNMAAMQPTMDQIRRDAQRQTSEKRSGSKDAGRKPAGGTRRTPKKALATTTYRESPAVTKRVVKGFTDWIATQTNAEDAASLRRDFEDNILGKWAKSAAADGLKRGDVADAMTYYWVTNWMIANRVTFTNRAQVQGARRLFASTLASTPAFARATNVQRQEMAEGFIYNATLQSGLFAQFIGTGDKALIQKVSDGRAASFKKEMGLDLRAMKLTNNGFAPKS